jgi:hypothetical protein
MIRIAEHERVCSQCANEAEPGSLLCETCEAVEAVELELAGVRSTLADITSERDEVRAVLRSVQYDQDGRCRACEATPCADWCQIAKALREEP